MIYSINKSLIVGVSPLFFQLIQANPMIKEIYLPIDENLDDFFQGKSKDQKLFLIMSILLDNQEFIKKWKEENKLKKENAIDHLMTFIKFNGKLENMVEEIEFIGDHFEEFENMLEFDKIPTKYLTEIFKKAKGMKSEKKIFKYNLELLKKEDNENRRKTLIESIEIEGLNHQEMKELIDNIKYEELTAKLFLAFKKYIRLSKQENIDHNESIFQVSYQDDKPKKKAVDREPDQKDLITTKKSKSPNAKKPEKVENDSDHKNSFEDEKTKNNKMKSRVRKVSISTSDEIDEEQDIENTTNSNTTSISKSSEIPNIDQNKQTSKRKRKNLNKKSEEELMREFETEYKQDSDYKEDPNGFSPLHYAAKKNLNVIFEILISKGEDINAEDSNYHNRKILYLSNII